MKIAIYGLGRMGKQIAEKLVASGSIQTIVHNRSKDPIDELASRGAIPCYNLNEIVPKFSDQRVIIWLMLPAEVVDEQIKILSSILPKNSLIIDGGNSDFRQTIQRNEMLKNLGLNYMDIGVSGGVWGTQNGFSMMTGGDNQEDFNQIETVLKILSQPKGAYAYFGPSGSGHFVKMVHNAIEYGMMESLAEGYRLLKEGPYKNIDLPKAADLWQHGSVITSWLNELIKLSLEENPELNGINGVVAQSGEALWATQTAEQLNIDLPIIKKSLDIRTASQEGQINFATKLLSAMRNKFGGHNLNN